MDLPTECLLHSFIRPSEFSTEQDLMVSFVSTIWSVIFLYSLLEIFLPSYDCRGKMMDLNVVVDYDNCKTSSSAGNSNSRARSWHNNSNNKSEILQQTIFRGPQQQLLDNCKNFRVFKLLTFQYYFSLRNSEIFFKSSSAVFWTSSTFSSTSLKVIFLFLLNS